MELKIEEYVENQIHLFYVDFPWKLAESKIVQMLKQYFHKGVVGLEVSESGVEHCQCFCEGSPAKYAAFIAKWKKEYESLTGTPATGRATAGNRRNYGRTKNIKRESKYGIAYCLKDKNYRFWGYEETFIARCETISYKKQRVDSKSKRTSMINKCKELSWLFSSDKLSFVEKIGENHMKLFDNPMTRNTLNRYLLISGLKTHREHAMELLGINY